MSDAIELDDVGVVKSRHHSNLPCQIFHDKVSRAGGETTGHLHCHLHRDRGDRGRAAVTQAELTQAELTQAELTQAELTQAELTQAELTQAELTQAELTQAELYIQHKGS